MSPSEAEATKVQTATPWGWGLCGLLFASTVLNYMDRQTISVVGERITEEFGIRFEDLGWVVAAFQLPYALFQVPAGFLADRWDVRRTYAMAVIWWSVAAIAVAWSPTLGALMTFRVLLGVGESFNWPCALKVTATVLPPSDRGLGNGIFNSGAAVGAVLTPVLVAFLTVKVGWRWAFALVGMLGLIWSLAWVVIVHGPARDLFSGQVQPRPVSEPVPRSTRLAFAGLMTVSVIGGILGFLVTSIGLSAFWLAIAFFMVGLLLIALSIPSHRLGNGWMASLGTVVRLRRFWVLAVVSISINVCWHFLVNWLPTYLKTDRGMAFTIGSMLSALPFLAADVGNIGGGAASRWLARKGLSTARARAIVLSLSAVLIASGAWVGTIREDAVVLGLLALMALGSAAFMANYFAYCQDVSSRHTGLVVGILGGLGNLFAAGFAPIAGRIKDSSGSFGPVFLIVGLLPFLGLAAVWVGWGHESEAIGQVKPSALDVLNDL